MDNDSKTDSSNVVEETEGVKEVESEEADWQDATGEIDFGDDLEEINWEEIHLTKAQFNDFLDEMLNSPLEMNEGFIEIEEE